MYLGPIETDRAKLQHARLLSEQEHLHEEVLQFGQKRAPKGGERIVIGMQIACDEAKWHRLIRGALNLTRAEHPGGIATFKPIGRREHANPFTPEANRLTFSFMKHLCSFPFLFV
jgi:hypothetical protein